MTEKKTVVDKLTEDCEPRPKTDFTPANPYVDALFKSWGGRPERVDNWQAIALSFLEVAVYAVVGGKKAERKAADERTS